MKFLPQKARNKHEHNDFISDLSDDMEIESLYSSSLYNGNGGGGSEVGTATNNDVSVANTSGNNSKTKKKLFQRYLKQPPGSISSSPTKGRGGSSRGGNVTNNVTVSSASYAQTSNSLAEPPILNLVPTSGNSNDNNVAAIETTSISGSVSSRIKQYESSKIRQIISKRGFTVKKKKNGGGGGSKCDTSWRSDDVSSVKSSSVYSQGISTGGTPSSLKSTKKKKKMLDRLKKNQKHQRIGSNYNSGSTPVPSISIDEMEYSSLAPKKRGSHDGGSSLVGGGGAESIT